MMVTDWKAQGKKNRRKGGDFEREVKADLRAKDWIVDKFSSNIEVYTQEDEVTSGEIITGKMAYNPFRKMVCAGTGFPDFICFDVTPTKHKHKILFVECKLNGTLSKQEKLKMEWLESEGFECEVASKDENGEIVYNKPKRIQRRKKVLFCVLL